jgi:disulfide bond formation protein DsbB
MEVETVHQINMILGLGAILLQILALAALVIVVFRPKENIYLSWIKNNFLPIGFFISTCAVLTSMFYSEVLHYIPCLHCWIDRVFIAPQAVIFGVAWFKKDRNAFLYSLWLTVLGLMNSLYHLYIYYLGEGTAPCDPSGVSCVQRLVNEFGGYISIPTLAFTGFFALLVLLMVVRFYKEDN